MWNFFIFLFLRFGHHTDDYLNVRDKQVRVLVNIDHPPKHPDFILAPQISQATKTHQIGGIKLRQYRREHLITGCCMTRLHKMTLLSSHDRFVCLFEMKP